MRRGLGRGVGDSDDNDNVSEPAVGDKDFAAVQYPVVSILLGRCADTLQVAAVTQNIRYERVACARQLSVAMVTEIR